MWRLWFIAIPIGAALIAIVPLLTRRSALSKMPLALGVAALLIAPLAWTAGAVLTRGNPVRPTARLTEAGLATLAAAHPAPAWNGLGNRVRLGAFLAANRGTTRYALATTSILEAPYLIIRTGEPVMALGGYTGVTLVLHPKTLPAAPPRVSAVTS
ncbi:MAG: hypothetical protein EXR07_18970 [Acetobacteraceae bacterium]|nr:hypothetical protein [Acetobacteraceae bacterium]